jgi:hypothetical protein
MEAIAPATPIHASIVKATLKVQAAVTAVAKDTKNQHGGYMFTSTDAIYASLTHKLAECGLMILCLEEEKPEIVRVEKDGKTTQWGKFVFSFVLATEEATWADPRSRRSLFIQITGPQTFMAAQSYAEKTYLRSLFKLPTGDMDLDSMPQGETEEDQAALNGIGRAKRKSSAEGKRDGSVKKFNALRAAIQAATDESSCRSVWTGSAVDLSTMARAWYETLAEDYSVKMAEFGADVEIEEQSRLEAAE